VSHHDWDVKKADKKCKELLCDSQFHPDKSRKPLANDWTVKINQVRGWFKQLNEVPASVFSALCYSVHRQCKSVRSHDEHLMTMLMVELCLSNRVCSIDTVFRFGCAFLENLHETNGAKMRREPEAKIPADAQTKIKDTEAKIPADAQTKITNETKNALIAYQTQIRALLSKTACSVFVRQVLQYAHDRTCDLLGCVAAHCLAPGALSLADVERVLGSLVHIFFGVCAVCCYCCYHHMFHVDCFCFVHHLSN
jgi:hypothetical protein